jgi:hypothetical protein
LNGRTREQAAGLAIENVSIKTLGGLPGFVLGPKLFVEEP